MLIISLDGMPCSVNCLLGLGQFSDGMLLIGSIVCCVGLAFDAEACDGGNCDIGFVGIGNIGLTGAFY
jgi:hypothetical protein